MCSPQHSATAVDAQSPQAPTHTHEAHNLLWVLWYTPARWQRGCVPDASRVGDTV